MPSLQDGAVERASAGGTAPARTTSRGRPLRPPASRETQRSCAVRVAPLRDPVGELFDRFVHRRNRGVERHDIPPAVVVLPVLPPLPAHLLPTALPNHVLSPLRIGRVRAMPGCPGEQMPQRSVRPGPIPAARWPRRVARIRSLTSSRQTASRRARLPKERRAIRRSESGRRSRVAAVGWGGNDAPCPLFGGLLAPPPAGAVRNAQLVEVMRFEIRDASGQPRQHGALARAARTRESEEHRKTLACRRCPLGCAVTVLLCARNIRRALPGFVEKEQRRPGRKAMSVVGAGACSHVDGQRLSARLTSVASDAASERVRRAPPSLR